MGSWLITGRHPLLRRFQLGRRFRLSSLDLPSPTLLLLFYLPDLPHTTRPRTSLVFAPTCARYSRRIAPPSLSPSLTLSPPSSCLPFACSPRRPSSTSRLVTASPYPRPRTTLRSAQSPGFTSRLSSRHKWSSTSSSSVPRRNPQPTRNITQRLCADASTSLAPSTPRILPANRFRSPRSAAIGGPPVRARIRRTAAATEACRDSRPGRPRLPARGSIRPPHTTSTTRTAQSKLPHDLVCHSSRLLPHNDGGPRAA